MHNVYKTVCLSEDLLVLAIQFGQFGQTMGTGHYYFDEFLARWPYHGKISIASTWQDPILHSRLD
jgi:hypothetical protein